MTPARPPAALLACIAGLVVAVVAYAALRAGQIVLGREPHPLDVLLTERSGYAWRAIAACFAGALAAVAAHPLARRAPEKVSLALATAVPVAAAAAAAQALLAP